MRLTEFDEKFGVHGEWPFEEGDFTALFSLVLSHKKTFAAGAIFTLAAGVTFYLYQRNAKNAENAENDLCPVDPVPADPTVSQCTPANAPPSVNTLSSDQGDSGKSFTPLNDASQTKIPCTGSHGIFSLPKEKSRSFDDADEALTEVRTTNVGDYVVVSSTSCAPPTNL